MMYCKHAKKKKEKEKEKEKKENILEILAHQYIEMISWLY